MPAQLQPVAQQVLTQERVLPNAYLAPSVIGVILQLRICQPNALKVKSLIRRELAAL
jgi:hypothetical protein